MARRNWVKNPARNITLLVSILWCIGATLLIIGVTDFFNESFFTAKNFVVGLLLLLTSIVILKMIINYCKNKNQE